MDWFSREGAHALKVRIEEYWRARGHDVMVALQEGGFHPAMRSARFDLRSDMVNGLPRTPSQGNSVEPHVRTAPDRPSVENRSSAAGNAAQSGFIEGFRSTDQEGESEVKILCRNGPISSEDLLARACEFAETGRYNHWEEIGAALEAGGMSLAVTKLGADAVVRRMLNARCAAAQSRK